MSIYVCKVCGFEYDEEKGYLPLGIKPNTKWIDIPDSFNCPICGAKKSDFYLKNENKDNKKSENKIINQSKIKNDLCDPMILSAIFLNLAKGTEKQTRTEESQLFLNLGNYFATKAIKTAGDFKTLVDTFNNSINEELPKAKELAKETKDRGSLRCLTWAEKVTLIMNGLLKSFDDKGTDILKGKKIFVCEICGFIYIGENKPDICPICKVPSLRIHEVTLGGLK